MSREMWDGHYADEEYIFGTEPNVFLASQQHLLKPGGPPRAENMYTEALLRASFADMDIVHLREHEAFIAEGTRHYGQSALIDMAARKKSD